MEMKQDNITARQLAWLNSPLVFLLRLKPKSKSQSNNSLRCHSRAQIVTDKQHHIIRTAGITNGSALPPPLPDMLSSQAKIKFGVRRRIITVTQPEAWAYSSSRGRLISLVPPGTHLVLLICIFTRIIRSSTILLLKTIWIITTS